MRPVKPQEAPHAFEKEGKIPLVAYGVPRGVDARHVQPEQPAALHRRHAHAAGEIHLVRGIKGAERPRDDGALVRGGSKRLRERPSCATFCLSALDKKQIVAVADAVKVDEKAVPHGRLVLRGEEGRAEKAGLLVVEKDEGAARTVLLAQLPDQLAERQNAGGVVVRGVRIGRAEEKHIKQRGHRQKPGQHERKRCVNVEPDQQHRQQHSEREEGQQDEQLIEKIDDKVFRRDEIRKGQTRAGVVMRGENDVGALGIAQHQVAAAGQPALFDPKPRQTLLQKSDEARFLFFCLAHLPVAQNLAGKLGHGEFLRRKTGRKWRGVIKQ